MLPINYLFVRVREEPASVENGLDDVLNDEQAEPHPGVAKDVGSDDEGEVERSVLDPRPHVLPLDLLKVELGEDVKPVGDLHDVEELEHEGHARVRVALPQSADVEEVLPQEDVAGPDDGDQVEAQQLAALVEFGVLHLGQVQFTVDFVQEVLLDDLVHDDGDQQVEERRRDVLK